MIEIIFIEIVSIVSFLYSIFMIFSTFAPINEMAMLFLWTVTGSMVYSLTYRKSKIYEASILLLFLPIILYRETKAIYFIVATAVLVFLYIRSSLFKGNHYTYVDKIKKSYLLLVPLIYINFISNNFKLSIAHAVPFIIIYILSSIILARTIRHLDSNMGLKNIRQNNIKHLLIMAIVFVIATFDKLRESIMIFAEKLITLIYSPLYWIGKIIKMPFEKIKMEKEIPEKTERIVEEFDMEQLEALEKYAEEKIWDFTILKRILGLMLIVVIIYIVYKLIIKAGNRRDEGIEYVEEREYIKRAKEKKKRRFKRDKYPKELKEQIRYYYRRFLNKLKQNDIEILKTDSSLEINEKAEEVFQEGINRIREIYIDSRYGDAEVDKGLVEEIESLYKKL
ncbi:hypothetical protein DW1_1221 [Proteiniborus sp. DW1]|uniref:hypothetical protein n=1 Tax=Proteiniborus sp. DW1 TaxID=1889883 RepID=UPI00092DEF2F|nr:hypothetical protein [Proteiniborus sp. DW1]SCG82794.1 hypothetical protein DW1_1221 [Proteiniborus sp. DW1]